MAKVLIVDDEALITMQLEEMIPAMGHQVAGVATSGAQALAMAKSTQPDLVLMDIMMPGEMDGIEAAARIRQELGIPILFLTAYADNELIKKAVAVDPTGYLVKPFKEAEVRANVEVALRARLKQSGTEIAVPQGPPPENALITVDNTRCVRHFSPEAEQLFGYTQAEVSGRPLSQLFTRPGHDRLEHEMNCLHITDRPYKIGNLVDYHAQRKDQSTFTAEVSLALWRTPRELFYTCIVSDITRFHQVENRLHSSRQEREQRCQELHQQYSYHMQVSGGPGRPVTGT